MNKQQKLNKSSVKHSFSSNQQCIESELVSIKQHSQFLQKKQALTIMMNVQRLSARATRMYSFLIFNMDPTFGAMRPWKLPSSIMLTSCFISFSALGSSLPAWSFRLFEWLHWCELNYVFCQPCLFIWRLCTSPLHTRAPE